MYIAHFGLNAAPFALTPDDAFAFSSGAQREAFDALMRAVDSGESFSKITGEVGTGKTLLCRRFLSHAAGLPSEARSKEGLRTVYIPNACSSPRALLLSIARGLKIPVADVNSEHQLADEFSRGLLALVSQPVRVVVCLDEAHAMTVEALEALGLVSNLEAQPGQRTQVVLFGRPALDAKLSNDNLRQLRARIGFQHQLGALTGDETEAYLAHRLGVAGRRGNALFPPAMARALHRRARGLPRLVNIIAHKSLMLAYRQGSSQVTMRQVRCAARDTPRAHTSALLARLDWPRWLRLTGVR